MHWLQFRPQLIPYFQLPNFPSSTPVNLSALRGSRTASDDKRGIRHQLERAPAMGALTQKKNRTSARKQGSQSSNRSSPPSVNLSALRGSRTASEDKRGIRHQRERAPAMGALTQKKNCTSARRREANQATVSSSTSVNLSALCGSRTAVEDKKGIRHQRGSRSASQQMT